MARKQREQEEDFAIQEARRVLRIEAESILQLLDKLDDRFTQAVESILRCKGRVIVTGIGKSGLIGKKIVATLTSTGTPAIFLHPVEGLHGDIGIVTKDDILIAISNSGDTYEINMILESIRRIGAPVIAFTGNPDSALARRSDIAIDVGIAREACPFGLAPTSSSTAALAMGDALAVALVGKRKFTERDFYKFHPGGSLGMRLRARVEEIMIQGRKIPRVYAGTMFSQAIAVMDRKNVGFVLATDRKNRLLGILTDGDVRRIMRRQMDCRDLTIDDVMTPSPKTIEASASIAYCMEVMQRDEITVLVVVDEERRLKGYLHLHDILGRGGTIRISLPD